MTRDDRLTNLLTHWLEEQPATAPEQLLESVVTQLQTAPQRARWRLAFRRFPMFGSSLVRYAAVGVLGLLAVVIAVGVWAGQGGGIGAPRPTASDAPPPSASEQPLPWSPDAGLADWPAPVRLDPSGGALTAARPPLGDHIFTDAIGDAGELAPAWADITSLLVGTGQSAGNSTFNRIDLNLAGSTTVPAAADAWIAYGIVLDTDGDGLADIRVGMDNARSSSKHREWITNLDTGETSVNEGPTFGWAAFDIEGETWYIDDGVGDKMAKLNVSTSGRPPRLRFYAWTGLIVDGVLVATDYAPGTGWIETYSVPLVLTPGP